MTPTVDAHIVVRFPALTVDVTLQGHPGEVIGIVGPNGAGKTTVLRSIAGLQPIDAGRIVIDGAVADDPSTNVFAPPQNRNVGVVFQDYRLFPHLSAIDNVAFGLRARGANKTEARATAEAWLERLGLLSHADAKPARLSGGQMQRVALARALVTAPKVLLLDEPLAAIDPASREQIRADLTDHLSGFNGLVVVVSHLHEEIRALSSRSMVISKGTVAWSGPSADLPDPHPGSGEAATER